MINRRNNQAVGDRVNQVNRAIDSTRRQLGTSSARASLQLKSSRSEQQLDVRRLNNLIRSFDKTWILPGSGAREPIGSNFQYKKTCANIFKARHGACKQLGFGIMCFNYCHEQGEKLVYGCQDASDATYCRRAGSFDVALAKYKKDSYKAKAFIHQMISRCYATSICNKQTGLLNSSLADIDEPLISQIAASPITLLTAKFNIPTTTVSTKRSLSTRARPSTVQAHSKSLVALVTSTAVVKTKSSERRTSSSRSRMTPRVVPVWQQLLIRTTKTTDSRRTSSTTEQTVEVDEEDKQEVPLPPAITDEPERPEIIDKSTSTVSEHSEQNTTESMQTMAVEQSWKSIEITTTAPIEIEKTTPQEPKEEREPGFWRRYQPGKWLQSIAYLSSRGRN
ncbi:hypothetical protein Tcan_16017 [Toxocara canis]|uniref:Uncharacterized protein n=1 Tax=Toxocara canis TaxID=6265 RepID=A0A0B2VZA5_TOXCA|nr:hypothetical protein Tcan_16017 [Toxocara canis]